MVIVEHWVWPTIPGDDLSWGDAVLHVKRNEIEGLFDQLRYLRRFEPNRIQAMQKASIEIYQRFQKKHCF